MRLCFAVLVALCLVAGCGEDTPRAPGTVLPRPSFGPSFVWSAPAAGGTSASPAPGPAAGSPTVAASGGGVVSTGWEITVYYTAVESFHDDEPETVTGCRGLDCAYGDEDLGSYPAGFVAAVKAEGSGRTASGGYLNWSYDIGYWLDTAARDTAGRPLEPFVSAAADPEVLPRGTTFRITGCGRLEDGDLPPAKVCAALRDGAWRVSDEFTPGLGGSKHLDAYIGEETGPDFTGSDWYLTLAGATVRQE